MPIAICFETFFWLAADDFGRHGRRGLAEYGVEPRALRIDERFFDEHLLVWLAD